MWEPGTAALPGDCLVRHVVRHAFPRARVSSMEEKSLAFPRSDPPQGVAPCVSHRLGFLVSIRVSGAMLAGERIAIRQPAIIFTDVVRRDECVREPVTLNIYLW